MVRLRDESVDIIKKKASHCTVQNKYCYGKAPLTLSSLLARWLSPPCNNYCPQINFENILAILTPFTQSSVT